MSRTYRRTDAFGWFETRELLDWNLGRVRRESTEAVVAKRHTDAGTDVYTQKSPDKAWRKMSHKARRAIEREELNKVLKDPDHDFNVDLENEAHRFDLWDWY